ncbi:response regulator [Pareuzebyella sediminis]|uniref:response regulator n=1 Tax=Pareuzebyella sediminis TaxID=2607998 RepID=UPI0011EF9E0F|nr:response regulator [Pareuzebyella sediminis]
MRELLEICIIDDDAIAVFGLKRGMKAIGLQNNLTVFENGLDALEDFEERAKKGDRLPSHIFVDLNMPIMDGWSFLEDFTKAYPSYMSHSHIFIMTSSINPEDMAKARTYGLSQNYLEKPVGAEVLEAVFS